MVDHILTIHITEILYSGRLAKTLVARTDFGIMNLADYTHVYKLIVYIIICNILLVKCIIVKWRMPRAK